MTALAWLLLVVLLVAPTLALHGLAAGIVGWLVAGAIGIISVVTYAAYCVDKRRAQTGAWRIPEFWLHVAEGAGGWPVAWIAQQRLRHKNRKLRFQIVFWLIVAAHQFAAIDYLCGGAVMGRWWERVGALSP